MDELRAAATGWLSRGDSGSTDHLRRGMVVDRPTVKLPMTYRLLLPVTSECAAKRGIAQCINAPCWLRLCQINYVAGRNHVGKAERDMGITGLHDHLDDTNHRTWLSPEPGSFEGWADS